MKFSLETKYSPLIRGCVSTNQNGDNFTDGFFPCQFSNSFGKFPRSISRISSSFENSLIFFQIFHDIECLSRGHRAVISQNMHSYQAKKEPNTTNSLFLLLMDENLAQVMQSMSLEEDVPRDVKTDFMPGALTDGF